jgi:hypothetical protein
LDNYEAIAPDMHAAAVKCQKPVSCPKLCRWITEPIPEPEPKREPKSLCG